MKRIVYTCLPAIITMVAMSFLTHHTTVNDLNGTKWISPITDDCHDALCFTSDKNVMMYDCEKGHGTEVGYVVKGNHIEINAYSKNMEPINQLIFYQDNGVLRQLSDQVNSFPRTFIKVETSFCN